MQDAYVQSITEPKLDAGLAFHAFARLTGHYPRDWAAADVLPQERSSILYALLAEQLAPVRVIVGYHGYTDEFALRKGLLKFMQENQMTAGFGVTSLPNLIVCRSSALLKMNGQPYGCPMSGDWWPVMVSNAENPLRLLIELIWTRLSNQFGTSFPMDDTLQMERLAPFLSAKLACRGDQVGWEYRYDPLKRKQLAEIEPWSWEPGDFDEHESMLVMLVAHRGEIDLRDADYRTHAAKEGFDPDALASRLVDRRILAWCDNHTARLIDTGTLVMGFLSDGRIVNSGETDLLKLWLGQQFNAESR